MAEPILAISGLHVGYGTTEILRGIDLSVNAGEIVAVLGSNGTGKSTLNLAISGVTRAWRWLILLRPLGPVRFQTALRTTIIGFMALALLPARIGELLRSSLLPRRESGEVAVHRASGEVAKREPEEKPRRDSGEVPARRDPTH